MAVHLTRIYTKTGDDGTTALGDMSRVSKTSLRLAAYADVDEANSAHRRRAGPRPPRPRDRDAAADRAERPVRRGRRPVHADRPRPCLPAAARRCRSTPPGSRRPATAHNERLTKLSSFILPGGTPTAALLHVARTVVRRAERSVWALLKSEPEDTSPETARYLNRLSDLLFILSRTANPDGDVMWQPGGER